MILDTEIISLEELYDIFIRDYLAGNYTEGVCSWNGDDALMGPRSFAHNSKKKQKEWDTHLNSTKVMPMNLKNGARSIYLIWRTNLDEKEKL